MDAPHVSWRLILSTLPLVSVCLTLSVASGQAAQSGSSYAPTSVILDNCYKIVFKSVECRYYEHYAVSTWKYYVKELPCAQDLSNWVLELPDCVQVLTAAPEPWERVHPDPNAHLDGIKWQTGGGFEAGLFTVKLRGCPPVKGMHVAAKGPDVNWGFLKGPGCSDK